MATLLSLPRELRDDIWDKACHDQFPPYSVTTNSTSKAPEASRSHQLLRTNRQIYHEAAPYVYETTVVNLPHPHAALGWIHSIGTRNSALIRHLVLKFTSLSFEQPQNRGDVLKTWSASLQLLPNLQSLTFCYEPKEGKEQRWGPVEEQTPHDVLVPREDLHTLPEPETLKFQKGRNYDLEMQHLQPDYCFQSITHAVLAIHEPIPSILVLYFAKLLKLSSASSLEQNITCLPTDFLAGLGFYPTRTYALTDGPPSIVFTYRKLHAPPRRPVNSTPSLSLMLSQLPQLSYLRLGCHQVDSSILAAIPIGIKTLDIAFTDPDPCQVASNLQKMRSRCPDLYTLTIAVSPLHDTPKVNDEDLDEASILEREAQVTELTKIWEPFYEALSIISTNGLRIWEGEGTQFRKFQRREGGMGITMF